VTAYISGEVKLDLAKFQPAPLVPAAPPVPATQQSPSPNVRWRSCFPERMLGAHRPSSRILPGPCRINYAHIYSTGIRDGYLVCQRPTRNGGSVKYHSVTTEGANAGSSCAASRFATARKAPLRRRVAREITREMPNIWFTADFHFGHSNIIRYCNRAFRNVEEMDQTILERLNASVKANDILYFLGDFCIGSKVRALEHRKQIRCKKISLRCRAITTSKFAS
jgi:hypothetical protein